MVTPTADIRLFPVFYDSVADAYLAETQPAGVQYNIASSGVCGADCHWWLI